MDRARAAVYSALVALLAVVVMTFARAQEPEPHWSAEVDAALAECDALKDQDLYSEAMYCLARYQAAASGLWVNSASPEFAHALPVLGLVGVFGIGLSLGSAVYRR